MYYAASPYISQLATCLKAVAASYFLSKTTRPRKPNFGSISFSDTQIKAVINSLEICKIYSAYSISLKKPAKPPSSQVFDLMHHPSITTLHAWSNVVPDPSFPHCRLRPSLQFLNPSFISRELFNKEYFTRFLSLTQKSMV